MEERTVPRTPLLTASRVIARKRAIRYAEERAQSAALANVIENAWMAGYDAANVERKSRA